MVVLKIILQINRLTVLQRSSTNNLSVYNQNNSGCTHLNDSCAKSIQNNNKSNVLNATNSNENNNNINNFTEVKFLRIFFFLYVCSLTQHNKKKQIKNFNSLTILN